MIDLTGQRFTRLTVVRALKERRRGGGVVWRCQCDCGTQLDTTCNDLRTGHTQSCGCLRLEALARNRLKIDNVTHGMSRSRVYKRWTEMIQRCENPEHQSFKNYGGRGIAVCKRWHTFENFYADMGDPPEGDFLLDRIHNSRGYYKTNCRWASRAESIANQRSHGPPPGSQGWRKRIQGRFA